MRNELNLPIPPLSQQHEQGARPYDYKALWVWEDTVFSRETEHNLMWSITYHRFDHQNHQYLYTGTLTGRSKKYMCVGGPVDGMKKADKELEARFQGLYKLFKEDQVEIPDRHHIWVYRPNLHI